MRLSNCISATQSENASVAINGHLTDRNHQLVIAEEADTAAIIRTINEHKAHRHDEAKLNLITDL